MNSEIADILKDKIDGLPFVDRIAGLVTTLTFSEETETGKKRKTFPVACNVSQADCMAGRYQDLAPDSAKKSVLYFEEAGGAQMAGIEGNKFKFRSNLRLVGWLNLKKMGLTDCGWSSTAVLQIIRELSDYVQPSNHGNKFIHFKVTAISQAEKTSAIFSRYTYDEAVTQYLIYPYDYFAINISVEFSVNKNCIEDAEIPDIEICDENTGEVENPTPTVGECWDLLRWNCDTNMWVRWHAPTTAGVYNITVNIDGSLEFTAATTGGTLTCENIGECETIQNIVQSVDDVSDDLAQEILARDAADDALQEAIDDTQADIDAHELRTDNPHSVTKAQVGLSNVDNTSDANKPVSTAQAAADALVASNAATDATTKANTAETNAKAYADGLVVGLWDDRGNFDASGGAYPSSGGSGTAGAILKGDTWTISVAGTLPTAQVVEVGDVVRALSNTPGNTQANWAIQQNNIGYTAENSANKATTMSGNTTSNVVYLSAKAIYDWGIATFQTALGYTAENSANKTDAMAGNTTSSIKYLSAKGVYDWVTGLAYLTIASAAATYQAIITADTWGTFINGLTSKTNPVDADMIGLMDSADTNDAKKLSWANLKATLKTYFDTLYLSSSLGHYLVSKTLSGTTITSTTSESIIMSQLIAGGTFAANDIPEISASLHKTGTNGSVTVKVYLNTTNDLTGSPALMYNSGTIASTARSINFTRKNSWFSSSTNLKAFAGLATTINSDEGAAAGPIPADIAWTVANAYYLIVTVTPASSSDTFIPAHLTILNKR